MINSDSRSSHEQRRWLGVPLGIAPMGVVVFVDWYSWPEITVSRYYLLPVALITWYAGRRAGLIAAFLSVVLLLLTDWFAGLLKQNPAVIASNAITLLIFLLIGVLIVNAWKDLRRRLQDTVAHLTSEVAEHERSKTAMHRLAGELSAAEDAERRRIAYDLHDGLTQMLSLVKMNLEAALHQSKDGNGAHDRLVDSRNMIDELIGQSRTLTFDLHPAMLDDLGLVSTLQAYGEQFARRTSAEVIVSETGERHPLPTSLANFLFRAIKELMSNSARHGKANEIITAVHWSPAMLRIVIDDNGCGFDANTALAPQSRRGLGLAGIQERLASLGGALNLESQSEQGTRVILEIPTSTHVQQAATT